MVLDDKKKSYFKLKEFEIYYGGFTSISHLQIGNTLVFPLFQSHFKTTVSINYLVYS
jgi:hypothetical protein